MGDRRPEPGILITTSFHTKVCVLECSFKIHCFCIVSSPPSGRIDLNAYYRGRELFSPKVNLLNINAEVEQQYICPADFSFAETCLKLQRSSGSVDMTKPANISSPPSARIDLNAYYRGGELFSPKVNLPGSSAAVEHQYKGPADFSFAEACLKLQRSSGSVKIRQQADDFVAFAIIQDLSNKSLYIYFR